tara:strand:- start:1148 stop:1456 length:309 start_codon:yes stop_codon:yes gene_type:complete
MNTFEDRKKSFEKKFAHDEEKLFKISAKRNKYLAEWVSKILKYTIVEQEKYLQDIIKADFQEVGDEDVFKKIKKDLESCNISDQEIRNKMKELNDKAKSEFQ